MIAQIGFSWLSSEINERPVYIYSRVTDATDRGHHFEHNFMQQQPIKDAVPKSVPKEEILRF